MTGYAVDMRVDRSTSVNVLYNEYKNETGSERFIVSMVMRAYSYLPPPD